MSRAWADATRRLPHSVAHSLELNPSLSIRCLVLFMSALLGVGFVDDAVLNPIEARGATLGAVRSWIRISALLRPATSDPAG